MEYYNKYCEFLENYNTISNKKSPFRCPVCNGKGVVPNGFYTSVGGSWQSTSLSPEKCRTCNGTGVIWG